MDRGEIRRKGRQEIHGNTQAHSLLCSIGSGIGSDRGDSHCRSHPRRGAAAAAAGTVQPPAVQPESQDHEYILGEWEGRLAVYRTGESEPDSVLDVYLGLLPPADAQALREGIPVEDQTELNRRLEDFMS